MWRIVHAGITACVMAVVSALSSPAAGAPKTIKAGRLVDPSGRIIPNAVIVVDNDRITSVGSTPAPTAA